MTKNIPSIGILRLVRRRRFPAIEKSTTSLPGASAANLASLHHRQGPPLDNGLTFDGSTYHPTIAPASVGEIGELVHQARAANRALFPFGGKTMLDLGLNPGKPGTALDLRRLDQVIDYPARDMTITVQAGITIGRLQEILSAERQRLAVDIPFPERATLGGAIAANASGPRRFGLGTLRDYVIGISVVNDEGQEIKAGGRVVKNVAGYDLMKLYTGSLGTLGIITQATLKLKPQPESSCLLVLPVALEQAGSVLEALQTTRTRPVAIDLLDPGASKALAVRNPGMSLGDRWSVIIGYEDNFKAVTWQIERIKQELPGDLRSALRGCPEGEARGLWSILTDFTLWPDADLSFKANLLPSAALDFCRQAAGLAPAPMLRAHAGNGIVHGHCRDLTLEQAQSMLDKLGSAAVAAKGNLVVTRCPAAWKTVLPLWGASTGDRIMMKAIKEKLDPSGIFNPGRFVDGI